MSIVSTRSDIVIEETENGATLTIIARNALVSWFVLALGVFVSLWPATLVAYGFAVSNYITVLVMSCVTVAVFWLTWRIGWRPRPFQIEFCSGSVKAGVHEYPYSDIRSFGLSTYGGDVVDTVFIGVPRNITIGSHIYIELPNRRLPVTVGLKDAQAKEALRLFGNLFERYGSS